VCRPDPLQRDIRAILRSAVDVRFPGRLLTLLLFPPLLLGPLTLDCSAPQPPPEPLLNQRDALARDHLLKRLAMWQQRLELEDWKITLTLSRAGELRAGTLGNIHWDEADKTARIHVLAASAYQMPYDAAISDMEFTVVHELIHLELASLPRDDASRGDEEHAVNHMADALLALDRGR
jgi:hypothetical protein